VARAAQGRDRRQEQAGEKNQIKNQIQAEEKGTF
jgi:hypothetical protein